MNKLNVVVLLASLLGCVALVAAAPPPVLEASEEEQISLAAFPNDDLETAYLSEENRIFSDFCKNSRDEIKVFLREMANGAAANVFDVVFTSFSDIGQDLVAAQKAAVQEGTQAIRSRGAPENAIESESDGAAIESESDGAAPTAPAEEPMTLIQTVSLAAKQVMQTVIESIKEDTFARLKLLKEQFTSEALKDTLRTTCNTISFDLQNRLESKLSATKGEMRQSASKNQALLQTIQRANIDNIGCLSAGRVSKVAKFCNILNTVGPSLYSLVGIN